MNKKAIFAAIIVFLFIAGLIAISPQSDSGETIDGEWVHTDSDYDEHDYDEFAEYKDREDFPAEKKEPVNLPSFVKPARWFRSNAGGMALEEIHSRLAALRYKYALVIDFTAGDDLPGYIKPYHKDGYFVEIRTLFEDGIEKRIQYIFREENGTARILAVLLEMDSGTDAFAQKDGNIGIEETALTAEEPENEKPKTDKIRGFIEFYSKNSTLISEIQISKNGEKSKTDFFYKNNILISAVTYRQEEDGYTALYSDYYRYNRAYYLRAVERVYHEENQILTMGDLARTAFPYKVMDSANENFLAGEKSNSFPEFFGDLFIGKEERILFSMDETGKILTQTLYNDKEEVVWVISNTWAGDRIVSMTMEEGDTVLLAEYEYDSNGDRILERSIRNGVLERVVRSRDKTDIEELYLNGVVVLTAVWEDGRKISETRARTTRN